MTKTQVLKQEYELTNDFNNEAMFTSLKSQISNKVFRELIQQEKHSLTVEFRVFVNSEEPEDKDPNLLQAMEIVKSIQKIDLKKLMETATIKEEYSAFIDLFDLHYQSGSIDTRNF